MKPVCIESSSFSHMICAVENALKIPEDVIDGIKIRRRLHVEVPTRKPIRKRDVRRKTGMSQRFPHDVEDVGAVDRLLMMELNCVSI